MKGVGEGPIDAILSARDQDGPFRDLFDFCNRVDIKKLNKRVMEKLILSGAMDRLGPHRAALMATLEEAMRAAEQHAKAQAVGQVDMFGVLTEEIDDVKKAFANVPHWPDKVWLEGSARPSDSISPATPSTSTVANCVVIPRVACAICIPPPAIP